MNLSERLSSVIREVPDFPKPGILFKDITPVLEDHALCSEIVEDFYTRFSQEKIDAIVGVESRGFLFGMMMASRFKVPFVMVRKSGKLPWKTIVHEYNLEYGSAKVEMHTGSIREGWKVLIHDDLLATGGTAGAAAELVKKQGGEVLGFTFVIELSFLGGKQNLQRYSSKVYSTLVV